MAFCRTFFGSFLLVFMIIHLIDAKNDHYFSDDAIQGSRSLLATIDCNGECTRRCQLSSRQKICMRACSSCCDECNCVPPGTSGNKEKCPCYNNLTTHGGKKKCP